MVGWKLLLVGGRPSPDALAQLGILVVALQGRRRLDGLAVEFGKGLRQVVQRAAHDAHVVRAQQVRGQRGLRRLVFHVPPEMRAAQPPPQLLLGGGEEVLGDIVRALHDGEDLAVGSPRHGMPEQAVDVAVQVREDHRLRSVVGPARLLGGDLLAQLVMVGLGGGLDRLQVRCGGGRPATRGPDRPTPARQFVVAQPQDSPQLVEDGPATGPRQQCPQAALRPCRVRLVKYAIGDRSYTLATTLLDRKRYRGPELTALYHGRWSIEELYKISKQMLTVEHFHGRSERLVKQELYAHFTLIALTRLFASQCEKGFRAAPDGHGRPAWQANFQNSLRTVARHLEGLFLQHATALQASVQRILEGVARCRQRRRPGRSYPRRSRKPAGKWRNPKATDPADPADPA